MLHLLNNPGSTHAQLKDTLRLPPSTLSTYLSILLKKGVISRERKGKENSYAVVDEESLIKVLLVYRPSFLDKLVDNAISMYLER